jgi:hypothetical protein
MKGRNITAYSTTRRIISYTYKQVRPQKVFMLLLFMVLASRVVAAEAPGNWIYEKITVDKDQTELSAATVRSRNSINLLSPYAGVNHGLIMIRKLKGGDPEVLFAVDKGQFYTGDKIRVKIDGGDALWISVDRPGDRRTDLLFIHEPQNFIRQITNAKELKIAAQLSQNGEKIFDFNVGGLDRAKVGL